MLFLAWLEEWLYLWKEIGKLRGKRSLEKQMIKFGFVHSRYVFHFLMYHEKKWKQVLRWHPAVFYGVNRKTSQWGWVGLQNGQRDSSGAQEKESCRMGLLWYSCQRSQEKWAFESLGKFLDNRNVLCIATDEVDRLCGGGERKEVKMTRCLCLLVVSMY